MVGLVAHDPLWSTALVHTSMLVAVSRGNVAVVLVAVMATHHVCVWCWACWRGLVVSCRSTGKIKSMSLFLCEADSVPWLPPWLWSWWMRVRSDCMATTQARSRARKRGVIPDEVTIWSEHNERTVVVTELVHTC